MISSFGALLDANVLFSAPLRDTLLRAAGHDLYTPHWSAEILEEVRRNLTSTGRATPDQAHRLITTLNSHFPEALVSGYEPLIPVILNHPKDRHVVAAAALSRCQVIVTHNLRDFPDYALSTFNIAPQSPDDFLTDLYDLAPDLMTRIVVDQAADLRNPPQSPDRVLDKLHDHAPTFARLVRARLHIPGP